MMIATSRAACVSGLTGRVMGSLTAFLKSGVRLQATSSHAYALQVALQRWQLCSASRAFSAEAGDNNNDEPASTTNRGAWRSWVEQQLSGIDQAALNEQQQAAARQLQSEQQLQQAMPTTESQNLQQSAQADSQDEVTGSGDDSPVFATSGLGSPMETPAGESQALPASTPDVLDQSVSQLSGADPAESAPQTQEPVPAVETPAPPKLSHTADLSVDERVQVFLNAIRERSWEQTGRHAVGKAEGEEHNMKLPPSGYSELGSVSQGRFQGQMLNPARSFFPGQSYDPEDLLAPVDAVAGRFQQTQGPLTPEFTYSNKQVMAEADFRNLHFLNAFVSNGGQIPPRSKTKLQAKVHRHLARQIKTARNMALLPHEGRAKEFETGVEDLSDDDFAADGEVDDSHPGFRSFLRSP